MRIFDIIHPFLLILLMADWTESSANLPQDCRCEMVRSLQGKCTCPEHGVIPVEFWQYTDLDITFDKRVILYNGSFGNQSFPRLEGLTLSNLQHIEPGGFRGLENVQELFFQDNVIMVLEKNVFAGLHNLVRIDAGHGKINALYDGAFLGLSMLDNLNLRNNSIWSISMDTFFGLTRLSHLDLSYNNLFELRRQTFIHASKISRLLLQGNSINRIEKYAFINMLQLETLNLENNKFQVLPKQGFQNYIVVTVQLRGNKLRCDCRMSWISDLIDVEGIHPSGTCYMPSEHQGHTLTNVYDRDGLDGCLDNNTEIRRKAGSVVELTCPIMDSTWTAPGGQTLMDYGQYAEPYYLTDDGSLLILNTKEKHSGTYVCQSKNGEETMVYALKVQADSTSPLSLNARIALAFTGIVVCGICICACVTAARRCGKKDYRDIGDRRYHHASDGEINDVPRPVTVSDNGAGRPVQIPGSGPGNPGPLGNNHSNNGMSIYNNDFRRNAEGVEAELLKSESLNSPCKYNQASNMRDSSRSNVITKYTDEL